MRPTAVPGASLGAPKFLSMHDQMMIGWGTTGSGLLLRHTVAAPLLRRALARVLAVLPAFAGRLVKSEDGLTYDVSANNAGARLVIASTSTTLDQVRASLEATPYSTAAVTDPWVEYDLPRAPADIARKQCPLASVFLLHLSGGGSLLSISVHHSLADFEGVQTFVAHLSAAYNAELAAHSGSHGNPTTGAAGGLGCYSGTNMCANSGIHSTATPAGADTAHATAALPTAAAASGPLAPSPERAAARFDPAAVEGPADSSPLPAGVPPLERNPWVPLGKFGFAWLIARAAWNLMWRGGGMEARMFRVPPERLALLKQQAASELAAKRQAAAGTGSSGEGFGLESVEWVSTADALTARMIQLLHALPLRRAGHLSAYVLANVRPRLQPPLPAGQLGNAVGSVCLLRLRPSECSLGELAGRLRLWLQRYVVPRFRPSIHQFAEEVARNGGVDRLALRMLVATDPRDNALAPEGPLCFTNWPVRYELWQFGPETPLAFLPLSGPGPNIIRYFPAPDGRGTHVAAYLHRATWRQLDAMTGGDLEAAI